MDCVEANRRIEALMEHCRRVDKLGIECGAIDPDDPDYQRDDALIGVTLREARERRGRFQRRTGQDQSRGARVHVHERRPRQRRHRFRRVRRAASSSRGSPDDDDGPGGAGLPELRLTASADDGLLHASRRLSQHLRRRDAKTPGGPGVSLGVKQSAVIFVAELYWREHGQAATWDEIRRAVDCPRFVLVSIMRGLERDGFVSFDESPRSLSVPPDAVRAAVERTRGGGK